MKYFDILLGVLAAMGGFVDLGELVFAIDIGAKFQYRLLWSVVFATVGIIVYGEMVGRIAAVAKKPVFEVIRDRLGYKLGLVTLIAANLLTFMTCAAEIGGIAIVFRLAFAAEYRLMIVAALLLFLAIIFFLPFRAFEEGFGILGLAMIVFMVAVFKMRPEWNEVAAGLIPTIPSGPREDVFYYLYCVVALVSSIMLPYETYFYASGAMEDDWKPEDLGVNKITAILGFSLGALLCMTLVMVGAQMLSPHEINPEIPGTAAMAPMITMGKVGGMIALAGMFFAFGGAAIETCLSSGYNLAQFLGWPWGKKKKVKQAWKFNATWIITLVAAALLSLTGIDPVRLVEYAIVLSVIVLPLSYYPVLVLKQASFLG